MHTQRKCIHHIKPIYQNLAIIQCYLCIVFIIKNDWQWLEYVQSFLKHHLEHLHEYIGVYSMAIFCLIDGEMYFNAAFAVAI